MMPMVRPGFPAGAMPAGTGLTLSVERNNIWVRNGRFALTRSEMSLQMSPGAAQSPRKPPPPRNALDDLNIKDFM